MQKKAYSYIRFSTPNQMKGDSLRRQLEASREYARKHNLLLDESLRDIGVSAYKGKNAATGALRRFIKRVRSGHVEPGSILILESLDRLSRQQVFRALGLFSTILSAGVEIVTLADEQHYTADSINDVGQLIYSLMSLSRSHEESAVKSRRLSASWENKRRQAAESRKPMSKLCPNWLRLSDDRQRYEVIEDRAAIIRRIFEMSIDGTGQRKIAEQFNREGIAPLGRGDMWHASYIRKVLNSKVVIGEFQPMKDKLPIGDPIAGYFPAVVSEEMYYRAKAAQKQRRTDISSAGRKGETYSNLFTGMCKCKSCGSTFRMIKRGNYHVLRCNNNYMGNGCTCDKRWSYREVEDAALVALGEKIDWYSAFGGHINGKQKLESDLKSLKGRHADCMKRVERFGELVATAEGTAFTDARERYTAAMREADELQQSMDEKKAELKIFSPVQEKVDLLHEAIFELRFNKKTADELYQLRAHINAMFREAGLVLHFFDLGVIYEISTTGEAGVVITEQHRDEQALLAKAELVNMALKGVKAKLLRAQAQQNE